jgi:hypothetical protein
MGKEKQEKTTTENLERVKPSSSGDFGESLTM